MNSGEKNVSFLFSALSGEMGWLKFAVATYNITRTPKKRTGTVKYASRLPLVED